MPEPMGFFDLKGVLETLLARLGLSEATWERPSLAEMHPALHPGRTAAVVVGGTEVGVIGELHPQVRAAFDLPNLPVTVIEIDLDAGYVFAGGIRYTSTKLPDFLQDILNAGGLVAYRRGRR
jgi:phenylalanyl-tRNA synthetase beta chain